MKRQLKEMILLFFTIILNANSQLDPSRPIKDWGHAGYRGDIPRAYSSFISMVNEKGVTIGDDNDNAIIETFFHTLKVEAIHGQQFETRKELELHIFDYIEGFYNTQRKHSALGYLSPEQFEQQLLNNYVD